METRRVSRRRFLQFAGTATGGLVLAACSSPSAAPAPAGEASTDAAAAPAASGESSPGVLRWGHWDEGYIGKQFPWTMAGGVNHTPVVKLGQEGPFFRNANLELEPNLAESAEYDSDFTAFTVKLRQDIKWSDGTPFTAKDVHLTTLMVVAPESAGKGVESAVRLVKGAQAYNLGETETEPEGLIVVDDYTFRVELIEPWTDAIWNILGGQQTLPAHIYRPLYDDKETRRSLSDFENPLFLDAKMQIGTGPFIYEAGEKDVFLRYKKNPNYHGTAPQLEGIEFVRYGSADACLVAFERGEIDVMATSDANYIPSLEAITDATVYGAPDYYVRMMKYNWTKPYFKDPRVYQAIDHAIDRTVLCEQVLKGACIAWRQMGPGTEGFEHNPYDPEKAKQLLAEAGWDNSRQLELITDYTDPLTAELLPAIAAMLGQVGIQATPRVLQGPALADYQANDKVDLWYDGSWGIWTTTVWPGSFDTPIWTDADGKEYPEPGDGRTIKSGQSLGFSPQWAQDLVKEYRTATPERKEEILTTLQERTANDGHFMMALARYNRWLAFKNNVHGLDNPDTLLWNFDVFTNKSMAWAWSKDA